MIRTDFPAIMWRTSSYSGNSGNCVEVATASDTVGVRDTKRRTVGTLVVSAAAWRGFVTTLASTASD